MQAFQEVREHFKFNRIFLEDEGVTGNGLFAAQPTPHNLGLHVLGNILRVFLILLFSPIYLLISLSKYSIPVSLIPPTPAWNVEFPHTPPAVLAKAPSSNDPKHGVYQPSNLPPTWLLLVNYDTGSWSQVRFQDGMQYHALSYSYESAQRLANHRRRPRTIYEPVFLEPLTYLPSPNSPNDQTYRSFQQRHNALIARQQNAREFLLSYMEWRRGSRSGPEYVWLDEFCLYDAGLKDVAGLSGPRDRELGRLADIFRGATKVYVFCDVIGCHHIDSRCPWTTRLFTLAEIIHANVVVRMTFESPNSISLVEEDGRFFRDQLQARAALEGKWHLYAVMQHASNSGSASWQTAIHALIVEAIRRDEAGGFETHRFLGKGLNGLFPRRACLEDLGGKDGWADLAWLLELNQGFYNAAGLAAVCGIAEDQPPIPNHYWLGPPIKPGVGNERLEPCVTAFPIPSALNILTPYTIKVHHTLKRDPLALFRVHQVHDLLVLARAVWAVLAFLGFVLLFTVRPITNGTKAFLIMQYFACMFYVVFMIIAGSMYVHKKGWILLPDEKWLVHTPNTPTLQMWLGLRDHRLQHINEWGFRDQITPRWQYPSRATKVTFVDLEHNVSVESFVLYSEAINALIPLAIHGSGVTCMVLERPTLPNTPAHKVGMVNMPPYVRLQGAKTCSVHVGSPPPDRSTGVA